MKSCTATVSSATRASPNDWSRAPIGLACSCFRLRLQSRTSRHQLRASAGLQWPTTRYSENEKSARPAIPLEDEPRYLPRWDGRTIERDRAAGFLPSGLFVNLTSRLASLFNLMCAL